MADDSRRTWTARALELIMKRMRKVKIVLQGMAMGMDVTMVAGTRRLEPRRNDAEALRQDWVRVGKHLKAAIQKYEQTKQP